VAASLQASVREKDLLLREVYHRVKNNLQVISSLLGLQAPTVADPVARQVLDGARHRLRSMALVHERLYGAADLSQVDFGEHLRQLVNELRELYGVSAQHVRFSMDLAHIPLGIDVAMPCSMIVHELVTNALRHAFPHGRGEVVLRLAREGSDAVLLVGDDGVGLPPPGERRSADGLGLELVALMVDQIGGRMEVRGGAGTSFDVVFPVSAPAAAGPSAQAEHERAR
jgi:two-component sensor histidine kinase